MEPTPERLVMYGARAEVGGLDWTWVREQLVNAGAYWVVVPAAGHAHPRPVWGIWSDDELFLSIGSPQIRTAAEVGRPATVHLGSVNDVVIVEGTFGHTTSDRQLVALYNTKYDWDYTIDEYGPLTPVQPTKVLAWRSDGWAGRGGFQATGRWSFVSTPTDAGPRR